MWTKESGRYHYEASLVSKHIRLFLFRIHLNLSNSSCVTSNDRFVHCTKRNFLQFTVTIHKFDITSIFVFFKTNRTSIGHTSHTALEWVLMAPQKCNGTDIVILNFMLDLLSHMNDKDKQPVLDSTNADLLLDSGFKLSDIIVNTCSKLLDYILLKSGSISGLYFT